MSLCSVLLLTFTFLHETVSFEIPFKHYKRSGITYSEDLLPPQPVHLECIDMRSTEGDYWYESEGNYDVCGMYIIGEPDTLVEVEITDINIGCDESNTLAFVDGWELKGEYFPSLNDHKGTLDERYVSFCGTTKPSNKIISSQNVALVQFLLPTPGQSFQLKVRFIPNPKPCNVIAMFQRGIYTLKNYGERINCSMSIIYPATIYLVNVNVGELPTTEVPFSVQNTGLSVQCKRGSVYDYVELVYGNGLDTDNMRRKLAFCGMRSKAAKRGITLGCQNSVVRLVSSGSFFNSITFSFHSPPTASDVKTNTDVC